jgi:hypothetical protein
MVIPFSRRRAVIAWPAANFLIPTLSVSNTEIDRLNRRLKHRSLPLMRVLLSVMMFLVH